MDHLVAATVAEKGLDFTGVTERPSGAAMEMEPVRVGLVDVYGGSMPSGWTRKILEDFEFDFDLLFPPDLESGDLSEYDVLVLEDRIVPEEDGNGRGEIDPQDIPEEYRDRLGRFTVAGTVPEVLDFVREGGAAIAIGSSAALAYHAELPVENHLAEGGEPLSREEYFTPGSILDMRLEHVSPLTHGFDSRVDVLFSHSPTFSLQADAEGVRRIGWFDSATPLKSGWAWGQEYLEGGVGAFEADYGSGKMFIFGPKITFRSQSHGTFPFLFNGIYYGAMGQRPVSQ